MKRTSLTKMSGYQEVCAKCLLVITNDNNVAPGKCDGVHKPTHKRQIEEPTHESKRSKTIEPHN